MAVELIRQVWCDICLKKDKHKIPATEDCATILVNGAAVSIDLCEPHGDIGSLLFAEIEAYGHKKDEPRLGDRVPKPRAEREQVRCSLCAKLITVGGSGWKLHTNYHERLDPHADPQPIPVSP